MKALERITLVVPPIVPPFHEPPGQTPERVFNDYDRFAAELQQAMPAHVQIFEGMPNQTPREGMLLIAPPHGLDESPGLIDRLAPGDPRPLLLNATTEDYEQLAPTWAPAGIVHVQRYAQWRLRQDSRIREQLYGLPGLAPALAPLLVPAEDWRNSTYVIYRSKDAVSLPAALARYIDAYWRSVG